jgi:ketosteroid isomerase-like protein
VTNRDALPIARRYHDAWTSQDYEQAIRLLAPTLAVEVPVNDYPTVESFAQALREFGELVTSVELLSQMSAGEEAMLLYDTQVDGLGELRVVDHFTTAAGRIVRLRQVHDTVAVRAAGFAS